MDASDDINSLEAKALVRSLLAFRDHVRNSRVDIHTDNRTLKAALDNFGRRDLSGLMLPHYSPWPTPTSEGVNAFAQPIPLEHNIYTFPPFVLLGPLLRYFLDQGFHGALTLVVPDLRPRRFWWALLQSVAVDRLLLGREGDDAMLLFPSRSTHVWSARRLQWDLWAYRSIF